MVKKLDANFVITHPKGYELDSRITGDTLIEYNQENAFKNADFVYTKNWCSYNKYGEVLKTDRDWMVTESKMKFTNSAKFMHCLPIRRNVVATDKVLNSPNSLVIQQSKQQNLCRSNSIKKYLKMDRLHIFKIGGNIVDNESRLHSFLKDFSSLNESKILIHGGGKEATSVSNKLGIPVKLNNGRKLQMLQLLILLQWYMQEKLTKE